MGFKLLVLAFLVYLFCCSSVILAQQPYVGKTNLNCSDTDASSSVLGYSCNGPTAGCQAYLIFRSRPPYDSVDSISGLLGSDPSQLSQINLVSGSSSFPTDKEVIVPVNCSCSGRYYQANSSYIIFNGDNLFGVANNTYQGLSTCQALQEQNRVIPTRLLPGQEISVPIRCACPTANQSRDGVKYLMSYTVSMGDTVYDISQRFDVETQSTLDANSLTDPTIFFFTTLLVPLQKQPSTAQTSTPPPPPPPLPPPPPAKGSSRKWVYVVIGAVLCLVSLIASITLLCIIRRKKRKTATTIPVSSHGEKLEKQNDSEEEPEGLLLGLNDIGNKLKVYKFEELKQATDNFSSKSKISGSVYRGVIKGDYAAIKRINGDVLKEIDLLKKIYHFNLIRLSGVCFNGGDWYLIYEFAENGPLRDWIHSSDGSKNLSWVQRAQIALDIANGLNYLHSFTEPGYVHKNIDCSNILLDGNYRAKIANFAMARSTKEQDGYVTLTRHIMGTKGYLAPEYLENGFISSKLDVYAFGVVLLEIISGQEVVIQREGREMLLSAAFTDLLSKENAKEELVDFMDPALGGDYPVDIALDMVRLINRCLNDDAASRPSMDQVVQFLGILSAASLGLEFSSYTTESKSFSYQRES